MLDYERLKGHGGDEVVQSEALHWGEKEGQEEEGAPGWEAAAAACSEINNKDDSKDTKQIEE